MLNCCYFAITDSVNNHSRLLLVLQLSLLEVDRRVVESGPDERFGVSVDYAHVEIVLHTDEPDSMIDYARESR